MNLMTAQVLNAPATPTHLRSLRERADSRFASLLDASKSFAPQDSIERPGRAAGGEAGRDEQAYEAAQKLIASALVTPLLSELRDQPLDAKLFDGGFGQDAFRQQLDTHIADALVKKSRFPIVDKVYEAITRRAHRAPEVDAHG